MVTISNKYFSVGLWCNKKKRNYNNILIIGFQFTTPYRNGIKQGFLITNRNLSFSERNGYEKYKKLPFGFRYKNLKISL